MGCEPEELAGILPEPLCDPPLDAGRFVGTSSVLADALWSEFPGFTTSPTKARLLPGSGCSPLTLGAKGGDPSRSGPAPRSYGSAA